MRARAHLQVGVLAPAIGLRGCRLTRRLCSDPALAVIPAPSHAQVGSRLPGSMPSAALVLIDSGWRQAAVGDKAGRHARRRLVAAAGCRPVRRKWGSTSS